MTRTETTMTKTDQHRFRWQAALELPLCTDCRVYETGGRVTVE